VLTGPNMNELLFSPFGDYIFMQRALVGSIAVCLGAVPVGIFMTLRRMSLTGDAMAHAILPGAAIAYLLSGLSLISLTLGGLLAGIIVAALAGWVARSTHLKEDTSLASFYLISLALGVLVVSLKGSNVDLFHVLFGNILALDNDALYLLASICTISLLVMAVLYRPLIIECVDPSFLRRSGRASSVAHYGASRFWVKTLDGILITSVLMSFSGCYAGLLLSFYFDLPAGPAIVLSLGCIYIASLFVGLNGGLLEKLYPKAHLTG